MNMSSDVNTVNKLTTDITDTITCTMKDGTSIITPTFVLNYNASYFNANYLYSDTTDRYYFITDIEIAPAGKILIHCKVDVLMTYKTSILSLTCNIVRQENATAEQGAGKYVDSYYTTYAQKQNIIDTIGTLWGDLGSGSACYLVGTT